MSEKGVVPAEIGSLLQTCEDEPIHQPGSVQAHGAVLVVREPKMEIIQASANTESILGKGPRKLLDKTVFELLAPQSSDRLSQELLAQNLDGNPFFLPALRFRSVKTALDGLIHRWQGLLLLEVQPRANGSGRDWEQGQVWIRNAIGVLQGADSTQSLYHEAARLARELTGFERVMIYQFAEDQSGEVVAECAKSGLEPYLGQRYPASDIPRQARELYLLNPVRLLCDVDGVGAEMVPLVTPGSGRPVDMSFCLLRSLSPVHQQYLKNMEVKASMSISIVRENRLWGLLACHHGKPKYVPHELVAICGLLSQMLSVQIAAKEDQESRGYVARLREVREALTKQLSEQDDIGDALAKSGTNVLSGMEAGGAAVCLRDRTLLIGETPDAEEVQQLAEWICRNHQGRTFSTSCLSEAYPPGAKLKDRASGMLEVLLSADHAECILWFRPEVVKLVKWGGDPSKPAEVAGGGGALTPRRSFELWEETVRNTSEPWKPWEIDAADRLGRGVVEAMLRQEVARREKAEAEIRKSNEQLENRVRERTAELLQSNTELRQFAYVTSHDLKEPLRSVAGFAQLLEREYKGQLESEAHEYLEHIVEGVHRMNDLIRSLLAYSRLSRDSEIEFEALPADAALKVALKNLNRKIEESQAEVTCGELPTVRGSKVLLAQVFQNLIDNAIKFRSTENPKVKITGTRSEDDWVFAVEDNGLGIPRDFTKRVFEIFKRLHGDRYEGSGIGLAICKRIIERHEGQIWVSSEPGRGATFYFTIPAVSAAAAGLERSKA